MGRLFLKKIVFKSIILTVFFSFSTSADEYNDFLIKESNDFLANEYNLIAPTTPETLIENWKQIRGIDQLTYLYKSDIALFRRTLAKPYMLHKWSSIRMPFEMLNHECSQCLTELTTTAGYLNMKSAKIHNRYHPAPIRMVAGPPIHP